MKYYITTAIDYINGKPHIGHSWEKVASDVLARWHRLKGDQVFFLTGSDEHGAKIASYAEKAGLEPQEYADQMVENFKSAWSNLFISHDRFIRTTDQDHIRAVVEIMNKMKDNDALYEAEYEGLYCVGHEAFITEKDLVNGFCPEHQTKPELLKEKNWFLNIQKYKEQIKDMIVHDDLVVAPIERKNEVLNQLEDFKDVAITRPNVKWGIPVPWDENQTVYVWPDALTNYISGVGYLADNEQFKIFWPADVHVVGKDIAKFHCIIWPAILLAAKLPLPKCVYVHGYFTINNQKISKSLGNVIDPNDWVAKYGPDAVRYFLMREVPFDSDGDVSEEKLKARYDGDLANGLGNLVSRVTNMIEKYCHGEVPVTVPPHMELEEVGPLVEGFRFHEALQKVWEAIAWANQYIDETKPWDLAKTDQAGVEKILSELAAQIHVIAVALSPFLPTTADAIRKTFESDTITKSEPLFPRIETKV